MSDPKKPNNLKTALILGAFVVLFFILVFVQRVWVTKWLLNNPGA